MTKQLKKLTALALCAVLLLSSLQFATAAVAEAPEQPPLYLPLRMIFESAGAEVDWDAENYRVIIELDGTTIEYFIGSQDARIDGELVTLTFPVLLAGGIAQISYFDAAFLFAGDTGGFDQTILTAVVGAFQFMEALSLPGISVALVDADSGFTWTGGFGFADTQNEIFVDEHTVFGIGSIAKTVTAIAVMQLVEEGIIDLDVPVVEYLPGFSIAPSPLFGGDYRNITTRHLLTHTSGIFPNILGYYAVTTEDFNPEFFNSFLDILSNYFMNTAEGEFFTYNNNGYTVLGILVAAMTGNDNFFDDFVSYTNENIFAPAMMARSTFAINENLGPNISRTYIDASTPAAQVFMNSISTGSMVSTAYDMARFMHILLDDDGTLVNPGTVSRMMQPHDFDFSTTLGGLQYGLGFLIAPDMGGFTMTGHNGAILYHYADMSFDVDSGIGVFVAVSGVNGLFAMSPLASAIMQSAVMEKTGTLNLMPPRADASATPIEIPAAELSELEGLYLGQTYFLIEKNQDGILTIILPNDPTMPPFPLNPMSDGSFVSDLGRFWFDHVEIGGESEVILRQGDLGFHMVAARMNPENLLATESFLPWVGTFVAQPGYGEFALVQAITYGVDGHGFATMVTLQVAPVNLTVAVQTADDLFLVGKENITSDTQGMPQSFELAGMRFVRG